MRTIDNLIKVFPFEAGKRITELFETFDFVHASGFCNFSAKSVVVADVLRALKKKNRVLWIVNNNTEEEMLVRTLSMWTDYTVVPFDLRVDDFSKEAEEYNKRSIIKTVAHILENEKVVVVSPYAHLLQNIPAVSDIQDQIYVLKKGATVRAVDLFDALIDRGYEAADTTYLKPGEYFKQGEVLHVFPVQADHPYQVVFAFDEIESITGFDQEEEKELSKHESLSIFPFDLDTSDDHMTDFFKDGDLVIDDELEILEHHLLDIEQLLKKVKEKTKMIRFDSFPENEESGVHEHFLSVLRYQSLLDMAHDLQEKYLAGWRVVLFTKHTDEIKPLLDDKNIVYQENDELFDDSLERFPLKMYSIDKHGVVPIGFQSPRYKICVISDKEIASLKTKKQSITTQKVYLDFLTSLKVNDFVVHADHGIARFGGIDKKTIDEVTREYLKLHYAENDKLYVPIDQADKVNKYIGAEDNPPKLTRLGSAEWNTLTNRVKKETQLIAKELLQLYAKRQAAKGHKYNEDDTEQEKFEKTFPYEETPGQLKAINDVKGDMEQEKPMDRLVCGDVGFGKTEVAMRASFKAVRSGKQVAVVSPITILADQHFRSFQKRMEPFHVRVEMLSRFRSPAEQKEIVQKLAKGEIDVIIGTHRLLQKDIDFKNLGLVVIDEEQRFGVKQKEALKEIRAEVDVLTLTATPIPRTLNISLNKLRDITTITTPPPGRLPVITEVRKFSMDLIREAIMRELERDGQAYVLHNRVQTIDSFAEKLKAIIPEANFIVAHGKLSSTELEKRIIAFKNGQFNVLVSSTIIENGIDLSNANTLIVNNAEKFGLAQLYQLRGRVGRGKRQAYAYFLYHAQRLKLDAKKRLRAIVEASELGSGFQIAMKDLEIRGAGDILGANQHGAINVVGVSHFMRMLNKAVEELKAGGILKDGEEPIRDVTIEVPISAYIPDSYIYHAKDKINAYQKLSGADTFEYLEELREDLIEEYGKMPREVANLFKVLELKMYAKQANLVNVKAENIHNPENREIVLYMSKKVKPEDIFRLLEHNNKWIISGTKLKIKTKDLGVQWFEPLQECVKVLIADKKK